MRKAICAILVALAAMAPVCVMAINATEAFTSAPSAVFPLLDKNTRLDMVDYYNSGSSTPSKNKLSGQSRITLIDDDVLRFDMSGASAYQIVVLPCEGKEIIALIETVATPAPDSKISFYSTDWTALDGRYFETPQLKQWLTDAGRDNQPMVEMMMPFMLVGYDYDTKSGQLTLVNNVAKFLSEDIYGQIAPYLCDRLVYKWNGKRFEPVK